MQKRIPVQIRCRWLDRLVAHNNMKKAGIRRVNKHDYTTYKNAFGMTMQDRIDSYFSRHWRETIDATTIKLGGKNK